MSDLDDIRTCDTCGFEWIRGVVDCPVCRLDSVLVLLREVSDSETWELGTDLNRRIEAAIKAPK